MVKKLRSMEVNILEGRHQSLEGLSREDILRIISPDPGPVQRDGAAQTWRAASDRNFGCHSFQTTEQLPAAEDSVNLDSYWTMDGIVDTGQLFFDPFATTT